MTDAPTNLISALAKIMGEVGTVKKEGKNDFHRYTYATASDVFFGLQPLLAKHGIIIFQDEVAREFVANDTAIAVTYEFMIAHASGEVWPHKQHHTGVAAAKTSKGSFDDKSVNKCHTAARKYFVLALFQIPTGDYADPDADGDVPTGDQAGKQEAPRQNPQKNQQKQPERQQIAAATNEVSPGDKGVMAALLHDISLAETEADLSDWYKDPQTQAALEEIDAASKDDVRHAWAEKRKELRATTGADQQVAA